MSLYSKLSINALPKLETAIPLLFKLFKFVFILLNTLSHNLREELLNSSNQHC